VAGSISGSAQPSNTLQPLSAFAAISDPAERSRAIFGEAAKVLTHPRCMNCHPATDRVLQGDDNHPHQPVATRDTPCVTCHIDRNFTLHERACVSQHSGASALDGGPDGLEAYRALADLLPGLLRQGGHSLVEIGLGQESAVVPLFKDLELLRIAPDLSGIPRCVILRKP
jgi:hypothetical protein